MLFSPGPRHDDEYLNRHDSGIEDFFFRDLTSVQRAMFWETTRVWFAEQGYTLYDFKHGPPSDADAENSELSLLVPASLSRRARKAEITDTHPFAQHGSPPLMARTSFMIFFAQDAQGHHVAIKFVKGRSQEYEILKFICERYRVNPASCKGMLPVLDVLPYEENWFAIMPRWGDINIDTKFYTAREALDHTEYMLEALNFLHQNRIVHRDIHNLNVLANYFSGAETYTGKFGQETLREKGLLAVALYDFDISVVMRPGLRRLPWKFGTEGLILYRPRDLAQGEHEYDPYAFDVACMGNLLLTVFCYIDPLVPMLAPLLAGMTLPDPSTRFTAKEALQFFYDRRAELTAEELCIPLRNSQDKENFLDPWHGLDESFVARWAKYRAPPPSFLTQILRFICQYHWGHRFIIRVHQSTDWAKASLLRPWRKRFE